MRRWFSRSKTTEPPTAKDETREPESQPLHPATARILDLQRAVGNQAVHEMIGSPAPETALPVEEQTYSLPSTQSMETDRQEQEVTAPGPGGGESLDRDIQQQMESRFAENFSDVSVHTDEKAARSAAELDARAYTVGRDIYFARGMYAPKSPEGQRLLAHELTHVAQQKSTGKVESYASLRRSQPGDAAEREADTLARQVGSGAPVRARVTSGAVLALDRNSPKTGSKGPAQNPEEAAKPEPETPELTAKLDQIAQKYREMIKAARAKGHNVAADNLQRFLDGTGGVKKIDVAWLRSFSATKDAERVNQERFEKTLTKIAKTVEHGTKKDLEDHWDRMFTASPATELYYASGTSTIRSSGKFYFDSIENIVNFGGRVTHHWFDPYDWHEGLSAYIPGFGNISDEDALLLQKYRGAKPFLMEADWSQDLTGRYTRSKYWFDDVEYSWSGP